MAYATREQVAEQAEHWTDEVLVCRLKKHRFTEPVPGRQPVTVNRRYGYIRTTLGCSGGCGVVQHQEMSMHGHVFSTWTNYPKDEDGNEMYLMPKGTGKIVGDARDELRLITTLRAFAPATTNKKEPPRSKAAREALGA